MKSRELSQLVDQKIGLGSLIDARYTVLRELGSGAVGRVFLVSDAELDSQEVALKIPHVQLIDDEQALERFRNEILLSRQLSHPGIVRIYHSSVLTSGLPYFTMEYVAGCSLSELSSQYPKKRISEDDVCYILMRILESLNFAHGRGVIHRDLKPDNILVGVDGSIKISDFGIANSLAGLQDVTKTGECVGSPIYMAPEQFSRGESSIASDIYSLGILIYELLVAKTPFEGESYLGVASAHIQKEPNLRLLEELGVSAKLIEFVSIALQKSPEDRFKDISSAIDFLALEPDSSVRQKISVAARRGVQSSSGSLNIELFYKSLFFVSLVVSIYFMTLQANASSSFHADLLRISRNYSINVSAIERLLGFPQIEKDQYSALRDAITRSDERAVRAIVYSGLDFSYRDKSGRTVLHYFVENPQIFVAMNSDYRLQDTVVKQFQAIINEPDYNGETPLMLAIRKNKYASFAACIQLGAKISNKNGKGVSALELAISHGDGYLLEDLVTRLEELNILELSSDGRSVLQQALDSESRLVFSHLMSGIPQIDQRDALGRTVLMYLLTKPFSTELAQRADILLMYGASEKGFDNQGQSFQTYLKNANADWREYFQRKNKLLSKSSLE